MNRVLIALSLSLSLVACRHVGTTSGDVDGSQGDDPSIAVVTVGPNSFEAPEELPAGYVTVRFTNDTDALHSAHLIRLDGGHSVGDLVAIYGEAVQTGTPRPSWIAHHGGVIAEPGTGEATVFLEPGNYAWVCVMGEDSGDGPHFMAHEVQALSVAGPTRGSVDSVSPDAIIRMTDSGEELSVSLRPGPQTLEITNSGSTTHLLAISRLGPSSTVEDVAAWFQDPAGPPPAIGVAATTVLDPGLSAWLNVDLAPGRYVLFCMANADGPPHVFRGEIREVVVP